MDSQNKRAKTSLYMRYQNFLQKNRETEMYEYCIDLRVQNISICLLAYIDASLQGSLLVIFFAPSPGVARLAKLSAFPPAKYKSSLF